MVARTVKIVGTAYSTGSTVTADIEYNGNIVYSGSVPTIIQNPVPVNQPDIDPNWEQVIATFMTDTDITGQIPCKISVIGGTFFFAHFWMNYIANAYPVINSAPPPEWIIVPVPPADYFGDPNVNSVESDGVSNAKKNGETWDWRIDVGTQTGDWAYPIRDLEIFTFDFYVDPALVVTTPYTPPTPNPPG